MVSITMDDIEREYTMLYTDYRWDMLEIKVHFKVL